jgi:Na+-driven multidrug efflux pump
MEENKMGIMPMKKLIMNMALPMILSMLIGALYNVVDGKIFIFPSLLYVWRQI